jgi:uncharacterized damage-inducible protein DinB
MSMLEHLQRLFAYDRWSNQEVLSSLQSLPHPPQRSAERLAHILSAERLWLERMRMEDQSNPVWPQFTLERCKREISDLAALWKEYLASLGEAGLADTTIYKNTKGESFTSQKQDILLHVILHSAYHRGQIASDMRAAGFTPAYTDFIHAVRQGFVGS